jgi:hypothetical protein
MANPGHGLHFTTEALKSRFNLLCIVFKRVQPLLRDDFNGHVSLQSELMSAIDFAHPAFAEKLQNHELVI